MRLLGVSIVICCHNSVPRLPETLLHLKAQHITSSVPWEVIIVDNASTDYTAQVARDIWGNFQNATLKVVSEPVLGLSFARKKGFQESQYEFISFVDDDNWVAPDWVEVVFQMMTTHPDVGACGGRSEAVFEVEPPQWLINYYSELAVGDQAPCEGDITESRGWLWGAGICIRKKAWEGIIEKGWKSLLTGRHGNKLTSGEDNEICYMLRFLGWHLYYSPQLFLQHFIPRQRIHWNYFKGLSYSNGRTRIIIKAYQRGLRRSKFLYSNHVFRRWLGDLRDSSYTSLLLIIKMLNLTSVHEGNSNVLSLYISISEWIGLIKLGPKSYKKLYQIIREYSAVDTHQN